MFTLNNNSLTAFTILICLIAFQRIGETIYAKKNFNKLISKGGVEFGKLNYYFVIANQVIWLLACLIGDYLNDTVPNFTEIFLGLMIFFTGQFFRIISIATLKSRWTTKIIVVPNEPLIQKGIYKYLKHPNYLGVILESFGLPLIAGLWELSIILGTISTIVMIFKIRIEENALKKHCNYDKIFYKQKRIVPYVH